MNNFLIRAWGNSGRGSVRGRLPEGGAGETRARRRVDGWEPDMQGWDGPSKQGKHVRKVEENLKGGNCMHRTRSEVTSYSIWEIQVNPLYNEGPVQGTGEKKKTEFHSHFLENLAGLQCSITKNQRSWIELYWPCQRFKCNCQTIKRCNGEGGSFSVYIHDLFCTLHVPLL